MDERYIASIDLGTSKFGLCVARVKGDDVQVVYYKETPSAGIRASVVQNPMKASAPLKKAIEEAENELMIKILQVVVGMPRSDVGQETATGRIERTNPDEYISEEEVENLKAMALESYPLDDANSQIMYGENLAHNYYNANSVVDAWMASPTHRANIETASYTKMGVAAYKAANGQWYWAQEFG